MVDISDGTVSTRYRDLIDAADTIVKMASSAAEVMSSAHKMHALCTQMENGTHKAAPAAPQQRGQQTFYCVAAQMRLLMDTPEQLWNALEENRSFLARLGHGGRTPFYRELLGHAGTAPHGRTMFS